MSFLFCFTTGSSKNGSDEKSKPRGRKSLGEEDFTVLFQYGKNYSEFKMFGLGPTRAKNMTAQTWSEMCPERRLTKITSTPTFA